jgi:hypothetical protein
MIGEKVITSSNWGNRGGDDSVSGIYTTAGAAMVNPGSQVSVSTGTAHTTSASTPTPVVTANKSKSIFRPSSGLSADPSQIRAPGSDDDSMSGIYTAYSASMTKEERFRASVLTEERKILKEYSMESGSGSFESYPDGLFLPKTLITAKTPSPDKKKNQEATGSPFVSSVGTNDFDLDSIASDGSMGGEGQKFQVLGIKSMDASSPMGTEKTRSPSTLGGAAVLSFAHDVPFPDLVLAEGGYAARAPGATHPSSKRERKAAAAAAAATSQMRPRVCGYRLEPIICVLAGLVVSAVAVAVGAFIADNHMGGGDEGDLNSQNEFQVPTLSNLEPPLLAQSAPTAAPSLPTPAPSGPPPEPHRQLLRP